LFDILNYRNNEFAQINRTPFIKAAILRKARAKKMLEFQKAVFPTQVYLNNKDLDGFMDFFAKGHDCSQYICDIKGWKDNEQNKVKSKNSCNYCKKIAEKYLSFIGGESARQKAINKAKNSLKDLEKGDMFKI